MSDGIFFDDLSRLNNELATAQRELAKKNAQLERLMDQKNLFLGIAAHDLRNPLQVQLSYCEFLRDELEESGTPEQLALLRTISSSSAFMCNLVNDLLDYAAMEAGRLSLALKRTNIVDLVERNVELNRVLAEKRAITIEFASERISVEVLVDQVRFTQALNNLLGNALKFAPEGSNVVVRLGCDEATTEISVHNDGEGIPAEDAQRIFDPFERGRTGGAWGEKSTGLGLAIVKRIVDAHHGAIRVESEPGQGVTMFVCVPLARLAVSRREREAEIS